MAAKHESERNFQKDKGKGIKKDKGKGIKDEANRSVLAFHASELYSLQASIAEPALPILPLSV